MEPSNNVPAERPVPLSCPPPGLDFPQAQLLETMPWGVLVLDEQRLIRGANRQAARWGGALPEDLVGRPLTDAALPPAVGAALAQLLAAESAVPTDVYLPQHEQWLALSATRQPGGWVLYGQDITSQKQREQQYQALAENTPDVLTRWTPDLHLRYANAAFAAKTGQPLSALLGRTFGEMGTPADVSGPYMAALRRVFDTGQPEEHHTSLSGPHGTTYFHSRLVPELRDGEIETVLGIARDITALQHTQTETLQQRDELLQHATDQYHALFHRMDQGFCVLELDFDDTGQHVVDCIYRQVNPAFSQQSGITGDVLGKSGLEVMPDLEHFWFDAYGRVVLTGESERLEQYVPPVGRWFDVHTFRIGAAESRQVGVLFHDITARKQAAAADAFRLRLADALAPLSDAMAIQAAVTHLARQHFAADRCFYVEIEGGEGFIRRDAAADGLPSMAGTYPYADFARLQAAFEAGRPFSVRDVRQDPLVDESLRQFCGQLQLISCLDVPILKDGQPAGVLCLVQSQPRDWTAVEAALATEVAERTWAAVERGRAESARAASEEKYRTLFDSIHEGVSTIELLFDEHNHAIDFRWLTVNPANIRMTGLTPGVIGQKSSDVFGDLLEPFWLETYGRVAQTGEPVRFEYGAAMLGRVWEVYAARVGSADSHEVVVVYTDITERKQQEQHQAFLLRFSDTLRAETSATGVAEQALGMLCEQLQLDRCYVGIYDLAGDRGIFPHQVGNHRIPPLPAEVRLSDFPDALRVAHDRTLRINDLAHTEGLSDTDRQNLGALGMRALVAATLRRRADEPQWAIIALSADVRHWTPGEVALLEEATERTWAAVQRAQAEEALRQSEEEFHLLVTTTSDTVYRMSADCTQLEQLISQDFLADTLSPSRTWTNNYIPDEDLPLVQAAIADAIGRKGPLELEHRVQQADGTVGWAHSRAVPVLDAQGEVTSWLGAATNITARKQAEEALRASQATLAAVFAALPMGVGVMDAQGRISLANQQMQQYLPTGRIPSKDATQHLRWRAYHPDGRLVERTEFPGARALRGEKVVPGVEMLHTQEDGREVWTQVIAVPLPDSNGHVDGHVDGHITVILDIDALKRTGEALRVSEAKYRTLFETMDQGFGVGEVLPAGPDRAADFRWLEVNPQVERLTGMPQAALLSGETMRTVMPKLEDIWYERYERVALTGEPARFEQYAQVLGRWFDVYAYALEGPVPHRVALLFTNITARKQAEEALRLSEARLQLALRAGEMGSFEWTSDGNRITLSAMSEEVLGLLPDTRVATSAAFFELLHHEDRARHQALFDEAGRTGGDFHSIYRIVRPRDEAVRWIEERGQGTLEPATSGVCLRGVHWDVTAPVLAQQQLAEFNAKLEQRVARRTRELQASRDLLQSVFDTSLISMSLLEAVRDAAGAVQDFRLVLVSRELERETNRTDLVGKLYSVEYPSIRAVGVFDLMLRALATGEPQGMEYFYEHEGFHKWFSCQFVKMGDGLVATNLDISERKTAEQERARNLHLLEQAEVVAGLGSWDYSLLTQDFLWSEGMYRLFALPPGQPVRPDIYLQYVVDEDRARAEQLVHCLATGTDCFEETLHLRVGEQVKTVRIKSVVLRDEAGQPVRVLGVDLDISELQRLEADNLRLRLTQQRALFEGVQAAQETERKRMAESLHNGIGQILYATKLRLDQLHAPLLGASPALVTAHNDANRLLGEAIRQTRALSHELVPMALEKFGLAASLQDISSNMSTPQLRLRCQVQLDEDAGPLVPALQMALYRMAQELAQNIVKHARGATEASLELETMPGWALLRAEDNGVGFAVLPAESPGLGLRSIRDRVALLGGQLEAGSGNKGGAYVRIRIPLPIAPTP